MLALRLVVVAILAVPVILSVTFLVAARWLIYFLAGLLLMILALGSRDYVGWFWLAFLIPQFIGGLIDGAVALATSNRQTHRFINN